MSGTGRSGSLGAARSAQPSAGDAAAQKWRDDGQPFSLLDPSVLATLEVDTGGRSVARTFVSDYVKMWNKRIGYLTRTLANNDAKLAKDAVLSIKNSALMVGATGLAHLSVELERLGTAGDLAAMRASLTHLTHIGELTVLALQQSYLEQEPRTESLGGS